MKKLVIIAAAMMLAAAPAANAQGMLGKLKEKAASAVGNAVSGAVSNAISDKISEKIGGITDKISEKTGIDLKAGENGPSLPITSGKETLQPKRSSTFGWSGVVTPSTAQFPIPLMNEFPAVPSAAKLANPTEEEQIAFYKAVKAVTLRAEELNSDTTCEDSFTEKWRDEAEKSLQDAFGLTAAEMEALKSGNLSPEEEAKLTERVQAKLLGGLDVNEMETAMKQNENLTDKDIENMAIKASDAVYDKYDKEIKKYMGSSAAEFKQVTRSSMGKDSSAESRALEKKTEAYIKTLDAATQKEAKAFQSKLQKELMQAAMNSVPGAGMALQISKSMSDFEKGLSPMMEKANKIKKYSEDIMAAWPKATWNDADAKFSEADRKKVEAIKSQIYATDKPEVYNPLYLQAMEIVKTYRERAAKVWAADVQKRFDIVKNGMGDIIKIQRQAVADEIIPECALWRVPLNLVIEAGDILAEAYSEFPCNYPEMYSTETVREVTLAEGECAWWPEFYVTTNLDEVLAGNTIFKEDANGNIFQFNKGKWNQIPKNYGENMVAEKKSPASASFNSSDGKREVIYNADGGFLQFPEGDIVYPAVWEKRGNEIIWASNETVETKDGSYVYRIVKCTYKL